MSKAVMLAEVADLIMGQSPPSSSYNESGDGLPFYQGKSDFGAMYPTLRVYCTAPTKIAEAGDILMSVRAPVGATNICAQQSCIGRGIAAVRAKGVDRDFLYFYLKKIESYVDSLGSGAIFKAINKSQLAELPINEAGIPLPEQKVIAHTLSTVQRAIEVQERIIQTTTELKKALMQKLFTEGLRGEPQKETEIGFVPESWEVARIKDYCIESAFGPRFGSELYSRDGNILTLRTTDMDDDGSINYHTAPLARIEYQRFAAHYLQVGDVVVSRSGTCGIASVFEGHPLPVLPGAFLIRLRMKESVQPMFLRHYINSPVGRPYILQLAQGAIQKNISGTRLGSLLIPVPSRAEQEEISAAVGAVDHKLVNHRKKLATNRMLFRSLLHELMTAKARVNKAVLAL